ncbi:hypothetical protein RYX36_002936 [Vicia faba]
MDYWYLLGTCPPECSLPPLCEFQQRWGCSYLGCFFEEMYRTQWPHTCSNMCKMGWRWCYLYWAPGLYNQSLGNHTREANSGTGGTCPLGQFFSIEH